MAATGRLVATPLLLSFISVSTAFHWNITDGDLRAGSMSVCAGNNVELGWRYKTNETDGIPDSIEWEFQDLNGNHTYLASFRHNNFFARPHSVIQFEAMDGLDAAIRLTNVSSSYSGNYTVTVQLSNRHEPYSHTVQLHVEEPPKLSGHLTISWGFNESGQLQLLCGPFQSPGNSHPNVIFKNPQPLDKLITYQNGSFVMSLPMTSESIKEGDYSCVVSPATGSKCSIFNETQSEIHHLNYMDIRLQSIEERLLRLESLHQGKLQSLALTHGRDADSTELCCSSKDLEHMRQQLHEVQTKNEYLENRVAHLNQTLFTVISKVATSP